MWSGPLVRPTELPVFPLPLNQRWQLQQTGSTGLSGPGAQYDWYEYYFAWLRAIFISLQRLIVSIILKYVSWEHFAVSQRLFSSPSPANRLPDFHQHLTLMQKRSKLLTYDVRRSSSGLALIRCFFNIIIYIFKTKCN